MNDQFVYMKNITRFQSYSISLQKRRKKRYNNKNTDIAYFYNKIYKLDYPVRRPSTKIGERKKFRRDNQS